MGKKKKSDSKGKGALKTTMKTEKRNAHKLKKELAAIGEEDIKSLIAKAKEKDMLNKVLVEEVGMPGPRSNFTFSHHPERDEFYLFGGEHFDGSKTFMYNDMYCYFVKQNIWKKISVPNPPSPRCSHQAVTSPLGGGQIWMFGGEFASPSQTQFYHFNDLWIFHLKEKRWEQLNAKGGPSARSGHRMSILRKFLVVFGGFHEAYQDYHYFNDVHVFDMESRCWKTITLAGNAPSPRSACQLASVNDNMILLFGGYTKQKEKKEDIGVIHSDMYSLCIDKHSENCDKWKWGSVKQNGIKPSPRCSFGWITNEGKAYMFGGIWDNVNKEDDIKGTLFNDLYTLDLTKVHWYSSQIGSDGPVNDSNSASNAGPCPRRNAALLIKHNILYVFGGVVEEGDKMLTLQDMYCLDLRKSSQWKTVIEPPPQLEWVGSDESDDGGDMDLEGSTDEDSESGEDEISDDDDNMDTD